MSSQKISIEGLTKAIDSALDKFGKDALEALETAAEIAADKAVQELASTSPKHRGKYAQSWDKRKSTSLTGLRGYTIHNKQYQLTHLVEFGHVKRGGTGRTKAQAHIAPAEEKAIKNYEDEAVKLIEGS